MNGTLCMAHHVGHIMYRYLLTSSSTPQWIMACFSRVTSRFFDLDALFSFSLTNSSARTRYALNLFLVLVVVVRLVGLWCLNLFQILFGSIQFYRSLHHITLEPQTVPENLFFWYFSSSLSSLRSIKFVSSKLSHKLHFGTSPMTHRP